MELTTFYISCLFASVIAYLLSLTIKRYMIHQTLKNYGIPGPKPNLLSGNLHQLKKEPTPHNIIASWLKKYGDIFGYYIGEDIYIVVKDLELLKKVFIKDFNLFINRPTHFLEAEPFPKTLVGLRDKRWKEVRSIISPVFSSAKMKMMSDIMARKADLMVDLVLKKANNKEMFNIFSMSQGLTLDNIAGCALAMNTQCQQNENDVLRVAARNVFELQFNKIAEYMAMFPAVKKILGLLAPWSDYQKYVNFFLNHLKIMIKERRKDPNFKSADILQALLENNMRGGSNESTTKLSEEEVIANTYVVLLAGYETTANTLAFIFDNLVKHQEIQDRLYQEIKQAKDSSYATVQSLEYMDQVLNESLRMYPTVTGFISRTCSQDYDTGSYILPKGSHILAPVWNIHYDPELWPDPWKFDPDRFSSENKGSIENMSYLPFGHGPRNCIGARFAQFAIKIILFKLLSKVKLVPCEKTGDSLELVCVTFTTNPKNGVWLKAIPRNEN